MMDEFGCEQIRKFLDSRYRMSFYIRFGMYQFFVYRFELYKIHLQIDGSNVKIKLRIN